MAVTGFSPYEGSIPAGSLVLVTGATGFIASHVTNDLLKRGFRVRGTVRNFEAASWLLTSHQQEAETGQFEIVQVPDMLIDGAFDSAVQGASAVLHIAASFDGGQGGFETDAKLATETAKQGVRSIFASALNESSVKEFVFTGSIMAATYPVKGLSTVVGPDTFNDAAVEAASTLPSTDPMLGFAVYSAAKVAAEKEFLRLLDEHKPSFVGNVVSPFGVIGQPQHIKHANPHHNWVKSLYEDEQQRLETFPSAFFADVKDIALIHVATMLDPSIQNQRVHAWGWSLNWNMFLSILRELRPEKQWLSDFPDPGFLDISTDPTVTQGLLKKWGNQDGWTPLRQTLTENLNNPYFKFGVEQ